MRYISLLILMLSVSVMTGCASSNSGSVYSRDEARTPAKVTMGTVTSVRNVKIEGTQSGVGTVAGAVVGGLAGSTIGHNKGSIAGAVIGAVAGGLLGNVIEDKTTAENAIELTVKLDRGGLISIVQSTDELFNVGDYVRILEQGSVTRISH